MRRPMRMMLCAVTLLALLALVASYQPPEAHAQKLGDAKKDILDLADRIEKGQPIASRAAGIRKKYGELDMIMSVYKPQTRRGTDVERTLLSTAKRVPAGALLPQEKQKLLKAAYVTLAVAEVTTHYAPAKPVNGNPPKLWGRTNEELVKATKEFIKAVQAGKTSDIKAGAAAINSTCNECHTRFRDNGGPGPFLPNVNRRAEGVPEPVTPAGFLKPVVLRRFAMQERPWRFVVSGDGRATGWVEKGETRLAEIDTGVVRSGKSEWVDVQHFSVASSGRAFQSYERNRFTWFSAEDGKLVAKKPWAADPRGFPQGTNGLITSLSADGRWLAFGRSGKIGIVEVETGRLRSWPQESGFKFQDVKITANGHFLAYIEGVRTAVRRVPSGELLFQSIEVVEPTCVAVSPDGTTLAVGTKKGEVILIDSASKRVINLLDGGSQEIGSLAFSHDGRWLASRTSGHILRVHDAISGRSSVRLDTVGREIRWIAFRANGQFIAGTHKGEVLAWTLPSLPSVRPIAAKELEQLWTDLALADPNDARPAMLRLLSRPEQTVKFLHGKLSPPKCDLLERALIQQNIKKLTSDRPEILEEAERLLAAMYQCAEPYLCRAEADDSQMPDLRARARRMIETQEANLTGGQRRRLLRVLSLLERTKGRSAETVLRELSGNARPPWLRNPAAEALERRGK